MEAPASDSTVSSVRDEGATGVFNLYYLLQNPRYAVETAAVR